MQGPNLTDQVSQPGPPGAPADEAVGTPGGVAGQPDPAEGTGGTQQQTHHAGETGAAGQPGADQTASKAWQSKTLRGLAVAAAVLVVLGIVAKSIDGLHASWGVFAPAAVVGTWLVLDLLARLVDPQGLVRIRNLPEAGMPGDSRNRLRHALDILAVAPLTIASLGGVRAYAPQVLLSLGGGPWDRGAVEWLIASFVATVLSVAAWLLYRAVRAVEGPNPFLLALIVTSVIGGLALVTGAFTMVDPERIGETFEGHGVLTLFLITVVTCGGIAQYLGEEHIIGRLPTTLGMVRTPWVLLVVVTLGLAGVMDNQVGYHTPRVDFAKPATADLTTTDALNAWLTTAKGCREPDASGNRILPLVMVAAPGGGARAAYWTGLVMHGLAAQDHCLGGSIFAGSGVSGGSVGLAVWAAAPTKTREAVTELTGAEPLAADVAALLFRDAPRALTGLHPYGVDRAAVEEDAWKARVPGLAKNFATFGGDRGPKPGSADTNTGLPRWQTLLLLNGSDLSTGCKVIVTNLRVDPDPDRPTTDCRATPKLEGVPATSALPAGAVDARLFTSTADCGQTTGSLSLATAALLSARFPFVSPTGQMARCVEGDSAPSDRLYVGDGGYLENSGLHTLLALWADMRDWIETTNANKANHVTVVPVTVLVDNHFHSPATRAPRPKLNELTAPAKADQKALINQNALEQAARAIFTGPVPGATGALAANVSRWFVLAPTDRPQVAAPLGWSLSTSARLSLLCQVDGQLMPKADECPDAPPVSPDLQPLLRWLDDTEHPTGDQASSKPRENDE